MTPQISSYICLRNGIEGDYCFRECIESLLPVSTEVVVSEASSNDGTVEVLKEWQRREPRLRVVTKAWTQPMGEPTWYVKWLNEARRLVRYPYQLTLDADEVLDESAYPAILDAARRGAALWFERVNYIRNVRTVIAPGETCGVNVVRCGPSHYFMPSDEPYARREDEPEIRKVADQLNPYPVIHHYGFLRRNSGMFAKSKVNLYGFFGSYDERLARAELEPERPWWEFCQHKQPFVTCERKQPEHCLGWLRERGVL